MINVIFDCDNTFGVPGCDVDDGLALLYLLGTRKVNLLGLTCTYGNSDINTVYQNTKSMLKDIGSTHTPVLKGGATPQDLDSEAVDYLVETVNRYAGNVSVLATGSLTNLYGAYLKDNGFFTKINEVSLMGGITEPLFINNKIIDELNFSIDAQAALCVLENAQNLSIATGNYCLDAFFSLEGFEQFGASASPVARYIYQRTAYWFEHMKAFTLEGFFNWDVVAAAQLLDKELFIPNTTTITPTMDSLKTGRLLGDGQPLIVSLPKIKNPYEFETHVYRTYCQYEMEEKHEY